MADEGESRSAVSSERPELSFKEKAMFFCVQVSIGRLF